MKESPEDARDIRNDTVRDLLGMGVGSAQVPKITVRPKLETYGLPDDVEEVMQKQSAERDREWTKKHEAALKKFWIIFATIGALGIVMTFVIHDAIGALIIMTVMAIILWAVYSSLPDIDYSSYPAIPDLFVPYSKYKKDLEDYEYWKRKSDISHWQKLGGHQFEQRVASLFRLVGFTAVVSPVGAMAELTSSLRNQIAKSPFGASAINSLLVRT